MPKRIYPDRVLTSSEKSNRWRRKNLKRAAKYKSDHRKKNPELYAKYDKTKKFRHKDKLKIAHKAWRDKNREKLRAISRKKYAETPVEKNSARMQEWRLKNPFKAAATIHRRLARKRKSEGSHTADDLKIIIDKQNYLCANPHCHYDLRECVKSLDHKVPLSRGGSNWPDNLQWLCLSCNSRKGTLLLSDWIAREAERAKPKT